MSQIANTVAGGVAYQVPGLEEKFRVPVNRNDNELLAAARSFLTDVGPHKALLIEYGLDTDFLNRLADSVNDFGQSLTTTSVAVDEQVESKAEIGEQVREGMIIRRQLDVVVRNTYKNNAAKLVAWESAQHIEHSKKKKEKSAETAPQG